MEETCVLRPIAHVHSEFPGKFGIPRQSGVVPELRSELIFTPEFRNPDALRGIEGFDRLWLIWEFSANRRAPRGRQRSARRALAAIRASACSPRARRSGRTPLGMSCVVLTGVPAGCKAWACSVPVRGPISWTARPCSTSSRYLPYSDCFPGCPRGLHGACARPAARRRFSAGAARNASRRRTAAPCSACCRTIRGRPIRTIPRRRYGMGFAGFDIHFTVSEGRLTVVDVVPMEPSEKGSASQ